MTRTPRGRITTTPMYMIDGVKVPRKTWKALQVWGEHKTARFEVAEKKTPRRK